MKNEAAFQKFVIKSVRDAGGVCHINYPKYDTGLPDLTVLYQRHFVVELKYGNGALTEKQKIWRKRYEENGANYILLRYDPKHHRLHADSTRANHHLHWDLGSERFLSWVEHIFQ